MDQDKALHFQLKIDLLHACHTGIVLEHIIKIIQVDWKSQPLLDYGDFSASLLWQGFIDSEGQVLKK